MIDLTECRLSESEVLLAFNITHGIYEMAKNSGVLSHGEMTVTDCRHSFSDILMFSVVLSFGWPVIPISSYEDDAEEIHDIISYSWEKCCADESTFARNGVTSLIRSHDFSFQLSSQVCHYASKLTNFSETRKVALTNYLNSVVSLAHILYIRDIIGKNREKLEPTRLRA